jgi:tungstate transport system substrate-binding protein
VKRLFGALAIATLALGMLLITTGCRGDSVAVPLDLATTTSVKNAGLLDALLPSFTLATVHLHATGSRQALAMLGDEVVDIAMTHAPDTEQRFLMAHPDVTYRKFAYSQLVIVGPTEDPAGVRDAADAVDAFRRIAGSPMTFVSRGDDSGVYDRERALWSAAGIRPEPDRMVVSGSSMARALLSAHERQGYVLSDEASFRRLESRINLVIVRSNDRQLLNTYALVYRGDNARAQRFADWLTHGQGRADIKRYRIGAAAVFTVWPEGCPDDKPAAQPCF